MSQEFQLPHHFNYFSIDYNEEFSALYGGVLWRQTGEEISNMIFMKAF
jgi:hypothetical protein